MAEISCAVASKVVDSLFVVAKKEIGYMWNSSKYVEKLRDEAGKLEVMRRRVQELIDIAIRKGDKLSYGVEDWVKEADTEISKARDFLQQEANAEKTCCKIGVCGNWGTYHRYGKSATKMAPSLLQLQERGSTYENCVSVDTPAPGPLGVYQNKHLDDLHTQNSALGDIIRSLEDDNIQIIGIYGLGGVGKTTLAMEVVARVKNILFVDIAFTTVSQNADVDKIKKDIGEATKRIMNKRDKILIILDDVWEKLDLEKLCIPCGSNYMNCKILLTSRSEKVCQKMNVQSKICVNTLPTEEAWILFKRVAGERLETDSNLKSVALKVVKECGGLPLLIHAVGNALKDESIKSWNWALTQLQKHTGLDIDEEIRKSFTHLKLSYDYLKSEEAKSCFLLCSLWQEDHDILLEDLVNYVVGLEKFDDLDSIEDARGRVRNAVDILTSSGLLLNSNWEGYTRMHDVVRDVALLIASQGNTKFLVKARKGLTEWLPTNKTFENYTGISLVRNDINKLPAHKVLDISWNNISFLPQSFQLLTKLRTLDLRGNKSLYEISILGVLRDLEILILDTTGITEIPKEIAQLVNLRVLQVKYCRFLSRITIGAISALSRLEELCIDLSRVTEGVNDCIGEVMKLLKLKYLFLGVKSFDVIPEGGFNLENLKGFCIQIGDWNGYIEPMRSERYLMISSEHLVIPLFKWLKKLIEVSRPCIYLSGIKNLYSMMLALYDEGFNKLEHIGSSECPNVSCLVDDDDGIKCDGNEGKTKEKYFKELKVLFLKHLSKLEVLWKCPDEYISLTNVVSLYIYYCHKLERVFTVRVAQGLVNLKKLDIKGCGDLVEVIWHGDDESRNIIVFSSLDRISLRRLGGLKSFFHSGGSENCSIKYPSLVDVQIHDCKSMKTWGRGIHETPNLKRVVVNGDVAIVVDIAFSINEALEKSWKKSQVVGR